MTEKLQKKVHVYNRRKEAGEESVKVGHVKQMEVERQRKERRHSEWRTEGGKEDSDRDGRAVWR